MRRLILLLALVVGLALPASAQIGPQNITTNGDAATFAMGVNPSATIDVSGTWTGTLTFEGQANGTTWRTITVTNAADLTSVTTTTASGTFAIANVGYTNIRVHATASITGTAVVYERNGYAARLTLPASAASIAGTVAANHGGTGQSSYAVGDLLSADTTTTLSKIADVAVGQVLASGGVGTLPAWTAAPSVTSITIGDVTFATDANGKVSVKSSNAATTVSQRLYYGTGLEFISDQVDSAIAHNFNALETPPGAPTVALNAVSGQTCTAGAHRFLITFVTAGGETEAGTASGSVTCDGTHTTVALTAIPTGSLVATGRNVYATKAAGSTYFLVSTGPVIANNTATTYTFNTADASLTATVAPTANTALDTRLKLSNKGQVLFLDGLITTPAVSFINEPTSGWYRQASGIFRFSRQGTDILQIGNGSVAVPALFFASGGIASGTDSGIIPEAANTLAQRNGTNAQLFRVYNTYTDANTNERFAVDWQTQANTVMVGARTAATGTGRTALFISEGSNASTGYAGFAVNRVSGITIGSYSVFNAAGNLGVDASFGSTSGASGLFGVSGGNTSTSGSIAAVIVAPSYNQASGSAANTDLLINRTETAIGSGEQDLFDAQIAGSSRFRVDRTGAQFLGGANGQVFNHALTLTELTTIAAAATTDTTIQMPANSVVLGVSVRVTTIIPTATSFSVGDSGSATRFSTANVSTAANSTDPGVKAGAYYNASALSIRLTMNGGTPANNTGRVRVTIYYYTVTPPTS